MLNPRPNTALSTIYVCTQCRASFAFIDGGDRPLRDFFCPFCGPGEQPYICMYCKATFPNDEAVIEHLKTCSKHPLLKLLDENAELTKMLSKACNDREKLVAEIRTIECNYNVSEKERRKLAEQCELHKADYKSISNSLSNQCANNNYLWEQNRELKQEIESLKSPNENTQKRLESTHEQIKTLSTRIGLLSKEIMELRGQRSKVLADLTDLKEYLEDDD